jgi:predicted metal-dependent hydrolase
MNHSKKFWAHVAAACPAYKTHRRWLRDNTAALMAVSALG